MALGMCLGVGLFLKETITNSHWGYDWQTIGRLSFVLVINAALLVTAVWLYRDHGSPMQFHFIGLVCLVPIIVLIMLALTVPWFVRACCGSNEASGVGSMRTINTAEVTYASTYPEVGFTELQNLGGSGGSSSAAGLIDSILASGLKSGYTFHLTLGRGTPAKTYILTSEPTSPQAGVRAFCSDQTGVIRYSEDRKADTCLKSGTPLQ